MEHPPKQGLKLLYAFLTRFAELFGFNGTSTKTRIETYRKPAKISRHKGVLMEHPPKQGLKPHQPRTSMAIGTQVLMEHPPKQGLKQH